MRHRERYETQKETDETQTRDRYATERQGER